MNAFCTITVKSHTLSGCLFRGIHFTATRLQISSALLFEFRVAIFFLHFVSFSLIAFFPVVSFFFSSFFSPFYITGKAFVYLLLFYIFYDVCVTICFLAYATKILGLAVSSFPFALIIVVGTVLIFFIFVCPLISFTVPCLFVIKYLLILISGGCLITLSAIQLLPRAIPLSVGILYL